MKNTNDTVRMTVVIRLVSKFTPIVDERVIAEKAKHEKTILM